MKFLVVTEETLVTEYHVEAETRDEATELALDMDNAAEVIGTDTYGLEVVTVTEA